MVIGAGHITVDPERAAMRSASVAEYDIADMRPLIPA